MVYAHCIPNYEDKRDQIPWRCIRIEEELEKRNIPGDGRHETAVIKNFFEENDEVWTLEEIARETKLSEDVVEHVFELRPDLFKEVTAYVLVS
jgi:H2-forming N5,N10-methylenetetrahydromethanopterin dehydrogenase-like enzyme